MRPAYAIALFALLGIGLLTVCGGIVAGAATVGWYRAQRQPKPVPLPYGGGASMEQLAQLAEAKLFYPGSNVMSIRGSRADFRNPASAGYLAEVDVARNDVLTFYKQELQRRGWLILIANSLNARGTSEVRAQMWYREGVFLRYAEKDQPHPTVGQSSSRTVYQIDISNMRPDELKHYINLTPTPVRTTVSPTR